MASSVPRRDRKDLRNRLRAVARPANHRKAALTTEAELMPLAKPTVALPATPTGTTELRRDGVTSPSLHTAVPPSSEHPAMSANA